jgi:predicted NBD/HSP70 family sugar kinase
VHLLPDSITAALISAGGEIQRINRAALPASDGRHAAEAVIALLRDLLEHTDRPPIGVGIAVGGMVNTDTGTIVRVNLAPALDGLDLGPILERELGLPTWIDHHPRVQALGDRWFGQGRGRADFISLYVGEAIGAGMVFNGAVHRGPAGAGGEVGHTTVEFGGALCHCGRTGCWETLATHTWLREEARRHNLPGAATLTAGPLTRLAARGVPGAEQLLDTYARNIALGIANLHQTLAPEMFILHGEATTGGETLRGRIESHLHQALPPRPSGLPQLTFTTLHGHATLLGAAGLVLSHTLQLTA